MFNIYPLWDLLFGPIMAQMFLTMKLYLNLKDVHQRLDHFLVGRRSLIMIVIM